MRQIVNIEGLIKVLPFTKWQVYQMIKRSEFPLPYKKSGKRLLFDLEAVNKWFDRLPGRGI